MLLKPRQGLEHRARPTDVGRPIFPLACTAREEEVDQLRERERFEVPAHGPQVVQKGTNMPEICLESAGRELPQRETQEGVRAFGRCICQSELAVLSQPWENMTPAFTAHLAEVVVQVGVAGAPLVEPNSPDDGPGEVG